MEEKYITLHRDEQHRFGILIMVGESVATEIRD